MDPQKTHTTTKEKAHAHAHAHKGTKAQRHKGTKAQRQKGTKAQRQKGTKAQRHTSTHAHTQTRRHAHTHTRTHTHTDTQTHRHTDTQTHIHTPNTCVSGVNGNACYGEISRNYGWMYPSLSLCLLWFNGTPKGYSPTTLTWNPKRGSVFPKQIALRMVGFCGELICVATHPPPLPHLPGELCEHRRPLPAPRCEWSGPIHGP